ncbi:MAG: hypothetical protein HOL04_06320 [Gammaproteobacteria bacterium]|jgi:response regulator RpfG family c-di-GMP phosphodiesterase|nr:hypothetical protein [Gammaproteobacteria bacterium]MBT4607495.1 hypothetical protein [Thiotrichales bacterium]MBT3472168.1 hypothetical protein [Gammaproteobacteria bacterium]MBT3967291.1 hypothetical protein [Gammaproteobacteria bacterium]MBT4328902.1 hypothetical protein [Gammaproteobacteria bacterium]
MRVVLGMIEVRKPINFDIYSEHGDRLLSKGIILYDQSKVDKVLNLKCYTTQYGEEYQEYIENHPASSPAIYIEKLIVRLEVAYTNFITNGYNLVGEVVDISKELVESLDCNPDMLIGMIHLRSNLNHAIFRTFQNSVLAVLTAKKLKWGGNMLESIACASLTQNLGMYLLQLDLEKHEGELNSFQRAQIRQHPKQSSKMLMTLGVQDRSWIQTVAYHHERMDGSGYPYAHFGKDIPHESRLLAVVDRYGSMITPREYRDPGCVKEIMRYFLSKTQSKYDRHLSQAMISAIGLFPPGITVLLESGEIAIVTKRTSDRLYPEVHAVWGVDKKPYTRPVLRTTSDPKYHIVSVTEHKDVARLNVDLLWGDANNDRSEQPLFRGEVVQVAAAQDKGEDEITLF